MTFAQDLWEEKDPQVRMNLALLLADAATTLARMEAEEFQKQLQQQPTSTAVR